MSELSSAWKFAISFVFVFWIFLIRISTKMAKIFLPFLSKKEAWSLNFQLKIKVHYCYSYFYYYHLLLLETSDHNDGAVMKNCLHASIFKKRNSNWLKIDLRNCRNTFRRLTILGNFLESPPNVAMNTQWKTCIHHFHPGRVWKHWNQPLNVGRWRNCRKKMPFWMNIISLKKKNYWFHAEWFIAFRRNKLYYNIMNHILNFI